MNKLLTLPASLLLLLPAAANGQDSNQDPFADVEITSQDLGGGVYMLTGRGGNMALSVGEDGAFLVDDQFAPLTEKITAAVAALTKAPVRFVVNTHWHGDHSGGNENFGKAGAVIVAHDNVRKRMSSEHFIKAFQRKVPASPRAALPVITFADEVTFHWNADTVRVTHVGPAHTDGDSVIRFTRANVLHTGDTYFNGFYPFMDESSGGSLDGMIATGKKIVGMVDAETKIIPGHGPLSNRKELEAYVSMLETVRSRIVPMIEAGKTAGEVVAAKITKDLDAEWGDGFLKPDVWVRIVYGAAQPGKTDESD